MPINKNHGRDPVELERMALMASRKYIDNRVKTVQEAVLEILKDEPGLSQEHIRRVVETTNTNVLRNIFTTEKDKTVGFPLANAEEIIKEYGAPAPVEQPVPILTDYDTAPSQAFKPDRDAQIQPLVDGIKKLIDSQTKVPEADPTYVAPQQKAASLYSKCLLVEDWATGEMSRIGNELRVKEQEVKDLFRDDLLRGDITLVHLMKYAQEEPSAKPYLRDVIKDLTRSGILYSPFFTDQMNKASGMSEDLESLNREHPAAKALKDIEKLEEKFDAITEAVELIRFKKNKALKEFGESY